MELTEADRAFLMETLRRLADRPLTPEDRFYVPLYNRPGAEDPVAKLQLLIETAGVESVQLFAGFKGCGKTTELFRLRSALQKQGNLVLYASALDYVDVGSPTDETTVLLAVAGSFSDALQAALKRSDGTDLVNESVWERFSNFLTRTKVDIPEVSASIVKMALKTTPTFRQKLRGFLANRLGELKAEVNRFVEDGVKLARQTAGRPDMPIVFLFDSFDQVRGTLLNEREVIASVIEVFASHFDLLRFPYVHMVYTVHPWLRFVLPGAFTLTTLPSVRQWEKDADRTPYLPGSDLLREIVLRRLGQGAIPRIFGGSDPASHPLADDLIAVCGGDIRILLVLFRELVSLVLTWTCSLPVTREVIERAIVNVQRQFLPLAEDDMRWLAKIEARREAKLPSTGPQDVSRLTRFLDTHLVLFLGDGEDWYDVHPLIREHVMRHAVEEAQEQKPSGEPTA